jgi:hypothetical protein
MAKFFLAILILGFSAAANSTIVFAKQVVEKSDRMEINWSTLRIRFYGEAKTNVGTDSDFKTAEKKAWRDGLRYITGAVRNIYITQNENLFGDMELLSEAANSAANSISTSTFSYDTTYYSDGKIRVHLENLLAKAIGSDAIRFRLKEALDPGMIQHSGVLFVLDEKVSPSATYKIVDEDGETLFDVNEMAESSFKKNLMGRWFINPRTSELDSSVGSVPVKIPVQAKGNATFVTDRKNWEKAIEGHKALLRSGRIALALP